jgi:limonene-1,2-epoxide hydrolase
MEAVKGGKPRVSQEKEVVLDFLDALNSEDFKTARHYLSDDMVFDGVLGHREGADIYIEDMKKMRFKYRILKPFADGDDVCVLYDIDMSGETIYTAGWYKVRDNKIKSLRVVFDPRPIVGQ